MKGTFVRICAWFTVIMFSLMTLAGAVLIFTEDSKMTAIIAILMCVVMSLTGWYARKFGLSDFRIHFLSKPMAVASLLLGALFVILFPVLFASISGFEDSWPAIRNLLILFLPALVSSIAILLSRPKRSLNVN